MDEYQIVELMKDWFRKDHRRWYYVRYYVLLNGNRISIVLPPSFHESNRQGQISDRIIGSVYVFGMTVGQITSFEFPMFSNSMEIMELYVYKRGYISVDQLHGRYPLPNLKYFISGGRHENSLAIELVDLDVVANNLNLPKIMSSVLGSKLFGQNNMERDELYKINDQVLSQKLFAGHTWKDAKQIVYQYFDENKRDLSKEVFKISVAYQQVFRPYRVVYNTKTWQPVLV